jgi:uncharacterized membrane protein YgdD (TMEM256/DUF423 family)
MAFGVALGAFGAHGLKSRLSPDLLAVYETGVRYHLLHGGALFVAGILLFSGSLYLLALTGIRTLGAITPLGGLAWIAAWAIIATRTHVR